MDHVQRSLTVVLAGLVIAVVGAVAFAQEGVLPAGVKAVWDMDKTWHEKTPTRELISINGLWQWQPAKAETDPVPADNWGYIKVPGPWPGSNWPRANESQQAYPHPSWKDTDFSKVEWAWYQREIVIPSDWTGRRIVFQADYVNNSAIIYLDGKHAGGIKTRGGEVDITSLSQPGRKQVLSVLVRKPDGGSTFRGLCGDVYLESAPKGERINNIKIDTSVRKWRISADAALASLNPDSRYTLRGEILDNNKVVKTISSGPVRAKDLRNGRFTFSNPWKPGKLWDTNTPQNMYNLKLSLLDSSGKVLDEYTPIRFGFREFWADGRNLRLNGTRIFLFASPVDVCEVSAYAASYEGSCRMIARFKSVGVNYAYTHNYSCQPGVHISYSEMLKAADDKGMLIGITQPHFTNYDWSKPNADNTNGYAQDAELYVRRVQNHPSVVMYSTSHNGTGYAQNQNPPQVDGKYVPWPDPRDKTRRSDGNAVNALRAQAIVERFDTSRPLYHHESGNLGKFYTINSYLNFVPIQERSEWWGHWAKTGIKPLLLVEYGAPYVLTWTGNRGEGGMRATEWYQVEWGAQFRGDAAYDLPPGEKQTPKARQANSENIAGVQAMYIAKNWPAFRTWGIPLFNNWDLHYTIFTARPGAVQPTLTVNWDRIQRPGFSPDFVRTSRWDTGFQDSDWIPNREGEALIRYNQPVLAYIAGQPSHFTAQDHNFQPGQTIQKQVVVINNSRQTVTCDLHLSSGGDKPLTLDTKATVRTGEQWRMPLSIALPSDVKIGRHEPNITAKFSTGQTQTDSFVINVLPPTPKPKVEAKVAVFDPEGDTRKLLARMGVKSTTIKADSDLTGYDVLVIGKHALTMTNPIPDLTRVRRGLKVLVFEQTPDVLQWRLGFRIGDYCLRQVFPRIPDHPALAGLTVEHLHDWRGQGTNVPPTRDVAVTDPNKYLEVQWCGFTVNRAWRCGCQGSVASVLIEKPTSGDFLPIVDGGFGLQYSPLMEYREGSGLVLFCQMDVTGRTEDDPAASRLVSNILGYVSSWKPTPQRKLVYVGDPAGKTQLESAGLLPAEYQDQPLTADQVLLVGPGGGQKLAPNAKAVESWLNAGGRLLAVGLDQDEANSFLPFKIATKQVDYIGNGLPAAGMDSPLVGIAPADVYTREVRKFTLVSGGAAVVGDGVLAQAGNSHVVFDALVPWQFDYQSVYSLKPTFRHTSFTLTRLLANMGVRSDTSLIANLQKPLPARAMLEDVPGAVWLSAGENDVVMSKVWKGLPVGAAEPPKDWEKPGYDDAKWRNIEVPGSWENQFPDLGSLDGLFLYRVAFDVPVEMTQQDVTLVLGAVDDEDSTYVNGQFVGSLTKQTNPNNYWEEVRTYKLPKGLLKPGRNVLAVKVNDLGGGGGMKGSLLKRKGTGSQRWLSGLYVDKPVALDDPYRYYCW